MSVFEPRSFYQQAHAIGNYLIKEAIRGQAMAEVHIGLDGNFEATRNGILGTFGNDD